MPLADIRIDDALWEQGSPARRYEWRQALTDLLTDQQVTEPLVTDHRAAAEPLTLHVALDGGGETVLAAATRDGLPFARIVVPRAEIGPYFKDYLAICKEMGKLGEGSNSPRLEALDIAKRIAHDEAGEALCALTRPLGLDHASCRRLFTLLVTLHFDTTRLLLPHHRR